MALSCTAVYQNFELHLSGDYGQWLFANDAEYAVWMAGQLFYREHLLSVSDLLELIRSRSPHDLTSAFWAEFSGFYSLLFYNQSSSHFWLISDRLRSRPLFYYQQDNKLMLSDSCTILAKKTGQVVDSGEQRSHGIDEQSELELRYCGYVTGEYTLYSQIFQLRCAQALCFQLDTALHKAQNLIYDSFQPYSSPSNTVGADWSSLLISQLDQVAKRAVAVAAGRTIVLPLSGGYDSRALAIALKRTGYDSVVCFSFGAAHSRELHMAGKIAKSLDFPWYPVVYTHSTWKSLIKQDWFKQYCGFIHNGFSSATVQVLPAIKQLLEQGVIPQDSLVLPGHTGDFVSGGHIIASEQGAADVDSCCRLIIKRHYCFVAAAVPVKLELRIKQQLSWLLLHAKDASMTNSTLVELWNYSERQTKFICNSNRYYDFFALDWWMPLWDQPMYQFWQTVPLAMRQHKKLWIDTVGHLMADYPGGAKLSGNAGEAGSRFQYLFTKTFDYFLDQNKVLALVPFRYWLLHRVRKVAGSAILFGYLMRLTLKWQKETFSTDTQMDKHDKQA